MKPVTMKDIVKLLEATAEDKRLQLAELLESNEVYPNGLALDLSWRYQTPMGYLTRDPSFDEICQSIAKKIKLAGLVREKDSCWDLLRKIIANLIDLMIEDLPAEKREEALGELLDGIDIEDLKKAYGGDIAKLLSGGSAIWIGYLKFPALRNLLLRIVHGVARAALGRGLSLLASQKVLTVIAKRTATFGLFAGPVGWILTIWGINDLMGTNYKRIIPAVLFIYCIYIDLKAEGKCPIE